MVLAKILGVIVIVLIGFFTIVGVVSLALFTLALQDDKEQEQNRQNRYKDTSSEDY